MTTSATNAMLRSIRDLPAALQQPNALILVASSGQESEPPVSRTIHEKVLYVEALKKGFEAAGRACHVSNMTLLERSPQAMPREGPLIVLGKQCC